MKFLIQEDELQLGNHVTSLYFYAPWMPFQKKMLDMIGKIENKYKDIVFLAIDVDSFKSVCKRFNVNSIPEIITFVNGNEVKRINGLVLTSALKSSFADIFNSINMEKS